MDVSVIHDLTQHFGFFAAHFHDMADPLTGEIKSIASVFGHDSPLSFSEKIFHASKTAVLTGLFCFSAATVNVEGALGFGYCCADEIRDLSKIGHTIPAPGPAKPSGHS